MNTAPEAQADALPTFSIVIPLEFHRDQWKQCLHAWQSQTLADSQYELVLVAPPGFAEQATLATSCAPPGSVWRVVVSDLRHDIGLCSVGAEHARGQFLFFTESHCWPEPDVLALCLQALQEHGDWAGLSCRSLSVASSRIAEAEAKMYDADIAYGMTQHPWRKILDQCFVTRRDAYAQSGGFKPELGHFAEWALAANYHALGLFIGYLPDARFHHPYLGELKGFRLFTLDFVQGETRYLTEAASEPGSHLIEVPGEWLTQGNFDRPLAQALSKRALRDAWRGTDNSRRYENLAKAKRWLVPAIFGDRWSRAKSSISVSASHVNLTLANVLRSGRRVDRAFKRYAAAVVHDHRLSCIATARKVRRASQAHSEAGAVPCDVFASGHAGFHLIENDGQGTTLRWSETAAAVRIVMPAGPSTIYVDCAPIFLLPTAKELRFHLDGQEIPDTDVVIEPFRIVITARVATDQMSILGWTCSRFAAPNDPRVLGLPISKIDIIPA